jgi:uncharacterized RDD family membrane protein YckC
MTPQTWRHRIGGALMLQPEPLGVAPALIGRPLGTPTRRAAAMGIDLLLVALLSGSSRLWLVAGLVVLLAQLLTTRGGVPRRAQPVLGWVGALIVLLLVAWWRGQTVGKKLLKLRVLELNGAPMTVLRCLKRYGGYAAGMATGGIGFAQVLWDPNRQALHDKAAHTAVFDERGAAAG